VIVRGGRRRRCFGSTNITPKFGLKFIQIIGQFARGFRRDFVFGMEATARAAGLSKFERSRFVLQTNVRFARKMTCTSSSRGGAVVVGIGNDTGFSVGASFGSSHFLITVGKKNVLVDNNNNNKNKKNGDPTVRLNNNNNELVWWKAYCAYFNSNHRQDSIFYGTCGISFTC
jgi:hypothetical protein